MKGHGSNNQTSYASSSRQADHHQRNEPHHQHYGHGHYNQDHYGARNHQQGRGFSGQSSNRGRRGGDYRGDRGKNQNRRGRGDYVDYAYHAERSDDEDIEMQNYEAMRRGQGKKHNENYNDYFNSNPASRSVSPRILPNPEQFQESQSKELKVENKVESMVERKGFKDESREEKQPVRKPERKMSEEASAEDSSEEDFKKVLEESRLEQEKILERNADYLAKTKKPKKNQAKNQIETHGGHGSFNIADLFGKSKDTGGNLDIDMRTRITGHLIKDHQKESIKSKTNSRQQFDESRQTGSTKKKSRIFRPKYIGLSGKFEYRSMLKAGRHLISRDMKFSDIKLDDNEIEALAGFGKIEDTLAKEQQEQMLRGFGLASYYTGHYNKFADSK